MTDNQERIAFEKWAKSYDQHVKKFNFRGVNNQWDDKWHYTFGDVSTLWTAWQAALASHQGEDVGENGLKCCPFCGGHAEYITSNYLSYVRCSKCHCEGDNFSTGVPGIDDPKSKAYAAWNTRASSPTN